MIKIYLLFGFRHIAKSMEYQLMFSLMELLLKIEL